MKAIDTSRLTARSAYRFLLAAMLVLAAGYNAGKGIAFFQNGAHPGEIAFVLGLAFLCAEIARQLFLAGLRGAMIETGAAPLASSDL